MSASNETELLKFICVCHQTNKEFTGISQVYIFFNSYTFFDEFLYILLKVFIHFSSYHLYKLILELLIKTTV